MIKTKQDIFDWWDNRGNNTHDYNDLSDIQCQLDKSITMNQKLYSDADYFILKKSNWKHTIHLVFDKDTHECYRMTYTY